MLDREVTLLVQRLRGFTASRWQASAPPYENRVRAAFALAVRLAELGPSPVAMPWVGEHAVVDQIAVAGHDLVEGSPSKDAVATAFDEIERTRALLGI
jgi:hypothetical protein